MDEITKTPLFKIMENMEKIKTKLSDGDIDLSMFMGSLIEYVAEKLAMDNGESINIKYHEEEMTALRAFYELKMKDLNESISLKSQNLERSRKNLSEYIEKYDLLETMYDRLLDKILEK